MMLSNRSLCLLYQKDKNFREVFSAICDDNLENVKRLQKKQPDYFNIIVKATCGLITATQGLRKIDNYEVLKYLVEQGANVDEADECDNTPISSAICFGLPSFLVPRLDEHVQQRQYKTIKMFLEHGAKADFVIKGIPTVAFAIDARVPAKTLDLLIKYGANVNVKDSFDKSPLFVAIKYQNIPYVKCLLKNGAKITAEELDLASTEPFLNKKKIKASFDEKYAELKNVKSKEYPKTLNEYFSQLVENPQKAVDEGIATFGNFEIVKCLVENGANISEAFPDEINCPDEQIKEYLTRMREIQVGTIESFKQIEDLKSKKIDGREGK